MKNGAFGLMEKYPKLNIKQIQSWWQHEHSKVYLQKCIEQNIHKNIILIHTQLF
jgi:hypothetical protein